jgi:hypothetical protein
VRVEGLTQLNRKQGLTQLNRNPLTVWVSSMDPEPCLAPRAPGARTIPTSHPCASAKARACGWTSRRRSVRRLRRVNIAEHPRARRTVGASAAESECGRVCSTLSIIRCATIPIYGSTFIHTYIRQYHVNRARAMSFVEQSRQGKRGAQTGKLSADGQRVLSFVVA